MTDSDFLKPHIELLKLYVSFWDSPDWAAEHEVSRDSAAYCILDHAGMLYRYTSEERTIAGLLEQDPSETRHMILAACDYVDDIILARAARNILEDEALHPDEILQIEDIMFRRDGLETVLWLATTLAQRCLDEGDGEVQSRLAGARCVAAEIDDELLARTDVVSIASASMTGIYQRIKIPDELKASWWFKKARELDTDFEEVFEDALGLTPVLEAATENELFQWGHRVELGDAAQFVRETPVPYHGGRLAAASSSTGDEEDFRYFPNAENRIVTSSIRWATEGARCLLRFESTNRDLEGKLVWLSVVGEEGSEPGGFVVPHPYPGRDDLLYAETYLPWTALPGADHTPRKPVAYPARRVRSSLGPDEVDTLEVSAIRCVECDPDSRGAWLRFLESLLFLGEPMRSRIQTVMDRLRAAAETARHARL